MGQADLMEFMKKHVNNFFTIETVSEALGINHMSAYKSLEKLKDSGDLAYKLIMPPQGKPRKLYAYFVKDDLLEQSLHDFAYLKSKNEHLTSSQDFIMDLCILRELKRITKRLENNETKS